jgi:hypothetical protein
MSTLENKFHADMENIYYAAKKLKYHAAYFWQMVCEKGGYQTAKQLIHADKPSEGLSKLWELGRLDLSVEAHVLKMKYAELFSDEERDICGKRLAQYGYKLKARLSPRRRLRARANASYRIRKRISRIHNTAAAAARR